MDFDHSLDPFIQLDQWIEQAKELKYDEPNAMSLATVDSTGQPSNRIVYYKGLIRGGLSFYTNYQGRKGQELAFSNKVCVNFFWPPWGRQVRIGGTAHKLTRAESEAYFQTRPRISQLGAWASSQSQEIDSIEALAARFSEMEKKYEDQEVPCPPHWGGFHIIPHDFEFWIGHIGRLHERYCYQKQGDDWRRFMRFP